LRIEIDFREGQLMTPARLWLIHKFKPAILNKVIQLRIANLIILLTALKIALPNGLASRMGSISLPLNASPNEIRLAWGPGDAGSLLNAAITWSHLSNLDPVTQNWIVHLWSPGMSLIEVPLIWLAKIGIPLYFSILIGTLFVWYLVLRNFRLITKLSDKPIIYLAIVLTILLSWDFRYMIRDDIFYTEGISFGLLTLALLNISAVLLEINSKAVTRKELVKAGLLLGIAVMVRHVFDSGIILLLVGSLSILVFLRFQMITSRNFNKVKTKKLIKKSRSKGHEYKIRSVRKIAVFALIAFLVTAPWRFLISPVVYSGYMGALSSASADIFPMAWSGPETPTTKYWGSYGSDWACKTDPVKCQELNAAGIQQVSRKTLAVEATKSIFKHPKAYISTRLHYAMSNWIPGGFEFNSSSLIAGIELILVPILIIFQFILLRNRVKWLLALVWGSFVVTEYAQLSIVHFESRYFIPIRLLEVLFSVILGSLIAEKDSRFLDQLRLEFLRIKPHAEQRKEG